MRVALTGTPGTGKTTAAERADVDLDIVHLNEVIREEGFDEGRDEERDSLVADLDAVAEWLEGREDVLFESHLAHNVDADRVIVLRAHPDDVIERLEGRGADEAKARENAESEALDVILTEAVDRHGADAVYEVDTTRRSPEQVADAVETVVAGEAEPSAGTVSFVDWL